MSEEPQTWIIPLPYGECDAAFSTLISAILPKFPYIIKFTRGDRTAGSCAYTFTVTFADRKIPLGTIHLRQTSQERTIAAIRPPKDRPELAGALNPFLAAFWTMYQVEQHKIDQIPLIRGLDTDSIAEQMPHIGEMLRQSIPEHVEPKRGDSMDTWLDWRDGEQQRTGRRISLTYIAREGAFKIDTLKKKSAERRRQKVEDADNAPDAP